MNERSEVKEGIIKDISGCNGTTNYCLLREIVKHTSISSYMLEQMRCVDDFKWEIGERIGSRLGWDYMPEDRRREIAFKLWVDTGYAEKYARVYDDNKRHRELYDAVVNKRLDDSKLVDLFFNILEKENARAALTQP